MLAYTWMALLIAAWVNVMGGVLRKFVRTFTFHLQISTSF